MLTSHAQTLVKLFLVTFSLYECGPVVICVICCFSECESRIYLYEDSHKERTKNNGSPKNAMQHFSCAVAWDPTAPLLAKN